MGSFVWEAGKRPARAGFHRKAARLSVASPGASLCSSPSQAALRAFIDRHRKPGGLVYISYNVILGRDRICPFNG